MGGKPNQGTSHDLRLKENNKRAGTGQKASVFSRLKKATSKKAGNVSRRKKV